MKVLLCYALLLVSASDLNGQDVRLTSRLPGTLALNVATIADSAAVEGMPREAVVQKALEGASKGASAEQILVAARKLVIGMRRAREVFGADASNDIIVAGAVALRTGITGRSLQRFRQAASGIKLQAGLTLAVDLIHRGVPPDTSAMAVEVVLASPISGPALLGMRELIDRDIKSGIAPGPAAMARVRLKTKE